MQRTLTRTLFVRTPLNRCTVSAIGWESLLITPTTMNGGTGLKKRPSYPLNFSPSTQMKRTYNALASVSFRAAPILPAGDVARRVAGRSLTLPVIKTNTKSASRKQIIPPQRDFTPPLNREYSGLTTTLIVPRTLSGMSECFWSVVKMTTNITRVASYRAKTALRPIDTLKSRVITRAFARRRTALFFSRPGC